METAHVRWVQQLQFLAETPSRHAVVFDADRQQNTAPGPMEMLLAALGACTATDVVEILRKKRQPLAGLEVEVAGVRAEQPPRVWQRIELVYRLRGSLEEKAVQDAIELSQKKYCSVSQMLGRVATISYRYEILP